MQQEKSHTISIVSTAWNNIIIILQSLLLLMNKLELTCVLGKYVRQQEAQPACKIPTVPKFSMENFGGPSLTNTNVDNKMLKQKTTV